MDQKWKEDFHSKVFFSHRETNSRGILVAYIGTEKFTVKKQQTDHSGRILILDVSINDSEYTFINLRNDNTEKEQTEVLSNLFALLKHSILIQINILLWLGILFYFLIQT